MEVASPREGIQVVRGCCLSPITCWAAWFCEVTYAMPGIPRFQQKYSRVIKHSLELDFPAFSRLVHDLFEGGSSKSKSLRLSVLLCAQRNVLSTPDLLLFSKQGVLTSCTTAKVTYGHASPTLELFQVIQMQVQEA